MSKFTNKLQNQVLEFHQAFNHPHSDKPKSMSLKRAVSRAIWTSEESVAEYIHASSSNEKEYREAMSVFLDGLEQAFLKQLEKPFPQNEEERVIAQADALTDSDYFIKGSFVEIGVDEEPIFDIVQGANLSKLFTDENGNKYAKYRTDGKILKSPEFYSPEPFIKEEIQRQLSK
ncbi:hypothetical protein M3649_03425 [Ureibacillus chungkukjangi]|uniref:hypothetical protein n=1 Tax=Ureibacillus chungkukjangi TaxID=1202712 RepID=UPI002040A731|nr:hypothetical protein [Ureibacillus chungkukjangi]MCM3387180.1 hypothetical protein [Ureibacillus chungkukjangi]